MSQPEIRTIASIGDRPISSIAGKGTSSAVAELDTPAPRKERASQISGRVLDDRGDPLPKARVRVADGDLSGGRVVEAKTDASGGFTLSGLRSGSSYQLIAEFEGPDGLETGRGEARCPGAGIEIAVQADDLPADRRRASNTPPRGKTVSNRADRDEADDRPAKVNRDDIPKSSDVEEVDDADDFPAPTSSTKRPVSVSGGSGWKRSRLVVDRGAQPPADQAMRRTSAGDDATLAIPPSRPRTQPSRAKAPPDETDDGENPLPPAITPVRGDDDPAPDRPPPKRVTTRTETERPGPPPGAFSFAKEPTSTPAPSARKSRPTAPVDADGPAADDPDASPTASAPSKTTWSALAGAWKPNRSRDDADRPRAPADTPPAKAPTGLIARLRWPTPPAVAPSGVVETCEYDARRRQVLDFTLPDLDGNPVSLRDFDADFLLIDFWGTWCRPCLGSVPHLVELQERFGAKSLAVVGIACEEGPASANGPHVAEIVDQLKVNYTVLVSTKDGESPIQQALAIQAFPTMILLDRTGRIVWRDQGATTSTLARLDRVLLAGTKAVEKESTLR